MKAGLCLLAAFALVCAGGCGTHLASTPSVGAGGGGLAQPLVVSAPVLGFAWDSKAATLRQIDGVPGAAHVDASANTGDGFALAVAANSHDYALLLDAKGALYLATLAGAFRSRSRQDRGAVWPSAPRAAMPSRMQMQVPRRSSSAACRGSLRFTP